MNTDTRDRRGLGPSPAVLRRRGFAMMFAVVIVAVTTTLLAVIAKTSNDAAAGVAAARAIHQAELCASAMAGRPEIEMLEVDVQTRARRSGEAVELSRRGRLVARWPIESPPDASGETTP